MKDDFKELASRFDKDGNLIPVTKDQAPIIDIKQQIIEKRQLALKKTLGILLLFLSILGGSSIGAAANFIPVKSTFAKNAWRAGLNSFFFIVPAIVEFFLTRGKVNYRKFFTLKNYIFILFTLLFQVTWCFGLIYASLNTIQSHAYVFNNTHGLVLVAINYIRRVKLHRLELIGALIAVVGCLVISNDPSAERMDGIEPSVLVDVIDFASSIAGAFYFLMNANNVKSMPICFLILFLNVHIFFINCFVATFENPDIQIFSTDPEYGCFGFLSPDAALYAFLCFGIFSSFFGSAGYVLSLLFFSPLVCSNAFLLEPFFA